MNTEYYSVFIANTISFIYTDMYKPSRIPLGYLPLTHLP